ncbi:MAG: hypothetical protein R3213_02120 [Flavobacteriaceae bacterium]|nr:hypothetical protein [Flavobacteriaceae bacterium]
MKTIKKLVLVAAVAFSTVLSASTPKENDAENRRLTTEIQKFLHDHQFDISQEVTAEVIFTLNKNQEIVVLTADNCDERIENFIKSKLNYKQLSSDYNGSDKMFKVQVKLVPES